MGPEYVLVQLHAIRAQVDALILVLNEQVVVAAPGCPHVETEEVGTFGQRATRCRRCGVTVEAA